MLSLITSSKYWELQESVLAAWNKVCSALFHPFPDEEEGADPTYTGLMMCAYCGVVAMGCPLSASGIRRATEHWWPLGGTEHRCLCVLSTDLAAASPYGDKVRVPAASA